MRGGQTGLARLLGIASITLAGCSSDDTPSVTLPTVTDSAGVRIVDHSRSIGALDSWVVVEPPEAVIGGRLEDDGPYQFTEVRNAVRMSDGRIVVGDWDSREARYFDAHGTHILTVGGAGEGPGELRSLFSVDRLDGDTLVIGGWPIGYRYWFDERGDFIRGQQLGPWFPGMLGRTLVDGAMLLDSYEYGSYGNTLEHWAVNGPEDDFRPVGVIELVSRDGAQVDTLGEIRGETWHKTGVIGQSFAMRALPFTPIGLVAWSRTHVFVGHSEAAEVRMYDRSGLLKTIVRWSPVRVPVLAGDRALFREETVASAGRPNQVATLRRWLAEIAYPEWKPAFDAMISDEDGHLWVRQPPRFGDDFQLWTIYGPNGIALARLALPAGLEVLDVDATHVVAKSTDALGLETVLSYRVRRPS